MVANKTKEECSSISVPAKEKQFSFDLFQSDYKFLNVLFQAVEVLKTNPFVTAENEY